MIPGRRVPTIRRERDEVGEREAIHRVNELAFGGPDEACLVDRLRADGAVLLSLVAELESNIVGHILFSRMWIERPGLAGPASEAVALAPLAVLPERQRQGIGGQLIRRGLDLLSEELGERIVIVVGHPGYYPRFGFSPEMARTLENPFPPEAFMARELIPGALDGIGPARIRYPQAFGL